MQLSPHPQKCGTPAVLPQRQTRVIHAKEGMRLQVLRGRLWLTQPGVAQDLFLGPGASIDLQRDWVVVQADAMPDVGAAACAEYRLQPLPAPASVSVPQPSRPALLRALFLVAGRVLRRIGRLAPEHFGRARA